MTELGIYDVWQNTSRYRYTSPFIVTYVTAVVPIRHAGRDMWALLEPFDLWMWLALAGTVLGSATLMVVLAALRGQVAVGRFYPELFLAKNGPPMAFLRKSKDYEGPDCGGEVLPRAFPP